MSDRSATPQPRKAPENREKSARLALALRKNLARRKARQRARATGDGPTKDQG